MKYNRLKIKQYNDQIKKIGSCKKGQEKNAEHSISNQLKYPRTRSNFKSLILIAVYTSRNRKKEIMNNTDNLLNIKI